MLLWCRIWMKKEFGDEIFVNMVLKILRLLIDFIVGLKIYILIFFVCCVFMLYVNVFFVRFLFKSSLFND